MKLLIPLELYLKLTAYIGAIPEEVGMIGKVHLQDNDIVVDDIQLLPQTVTDVHVKVDQQGLAQFFDGLLAKGEKIGGWKLWIHSHPTFEAYFSGPDDIEIASFDNETGEENWIVALVMNQQGHYSARLQVFQPFPFIENDIQLIIQYPAYNDPETIRREIAEKVTREPFNVSKTSWPWSNKQTSHADAENAPQLPSQSAVSYDTNDTFDYRKEFQKKYQQGKGRKK